MLHRIRELIGWAKPVVVSRFAGVTAITFVILTLLIYGVVNGIVMPWYTRHDTGISVPDVRGLLVDDAEHMLVDSGLEVRRVVSPYVPSYRRDAVVEQDPKPNVVVKPGRRVYIRVNSGNVPMVIVPRLHDMSLRQARNSLLAEKLTLGAVLRDTNPSPYRNTVTRQDPAPGDSVTVGTAVDIWMSSGLGSSITTVPDIVGVPLPEAEAMLRSARLQFVVFDDPDARNADPNSVVRVIPPPGTEIPEGSEVRMFVAPNPGSDF